MTRHAGTFPITKAEAIIALVAEIYGAPPTPLHHPAFTGNEGSYLLETLESNLVSSIGPYVSEFEEQIACYTGAARAVATTSGTSALHMALLLAGVRAGEEVISQALTFVATCNAISYLGARPVFVDVDADTLGMSPVALRNWLDANTVIREGRCVNRRTGARIAACVPMHSFGLPCRIMEIAEICSDFGIVLIEDAAEALGSYAGDRHTGTIGKIGILSFNGNKIITTGGGGMILTDDEALADRAKHLTTTAKVPHPWQTYHDAVGYNYRMPNLNAALGCAQMERLPEILKIKAEIAGRYRDFCAELDLHFIKPLCGMTTNNWLNAVRFEDREARDEFLEATNSCGVMTRPVWRLMHELSPFANCEHDGLANSVWLSARVVNLPSSVPAAQLYRPAS